MKRTTIGNELHRIAMEQVAFTEFDDFITNYEMVYGIIHYKHIQIIDWDFQDYECIKEQLEAMRLGLLR